MRILFKLTVAALLLTSCVVVKPSWSAADFKLVKQCEKKGERELRFFVKNPPGNMLEDLATREVRVGARVIKWRFFTKTFLLYYEAVPEEKARVFPEAIPDQIEMFSMLGPILIQKTPGELQEIRNKLTTAEHPTFGEKCIYGWYMSDE